MLITQHRSIQMFKKLGIIVYVLATIFCGRAFAAASASVDSTNMSVPVFQYVYDIDPYFVCDKMEYVNGNWEQRFYLTFWFGETPTGGSLQIYSWLVIPNVVYVPSFGRNMCGVVVTRPNIITQGRIDMWAPIQNTDFGINWDFHVYYDAS